MNLPPAEEKTSSAAQPLTADRGGAAFGIVARHSGQCLDVVNGLTSDGANIRQWPCNGLAAQSFRLQATNDGYFYLINVNSGKVAEVASGSMGNNANVDQSTNIRAAYQQFQLVPTSNGWYKILARHSGKAVTVAGCVPTVGANVEQFVWANLQCQEWRLQPVGNVKLINKATGKVVTVDSGLTTDNANVYSYTYSDSDWMHYSFTHVSDGYYRMTPLHSGKAVEVTGCASGPGGNVAQFSWLNNTCQQWRFQLNSDGYVALINRNSGLAMDVASCAQPDKTNVQQWTSFNNDCQKFRIESRGVSSDPALDTPVHDPHVIKQGNNFYLTGTGGNIAIRTSTDQVHWSSVGTVFSAIPAWVNTQLGTTIGDLWAPDIAFFGGKYWLYYVGSVFGTNNSVIGVASSPTLDPAAPGYGWTDQGLVIATSSANDHNAIDPNVTLDANGVPWLAFGSFWSGIKMRRIDPTTGKLSSEDSTLYSLAQRPGGGAVEGPSILRANGFYYLFVAYDFCCQGADSSYRTMVGRSTAITGPYLDTAGQAMILGNALQVLSGVDHWRGPGGGTAYYNGTAPYFANHSYDSTDCGTAKLQVRPITWSNNWPVLGAPLP